MGEINSIKLIDITGGGDCSLYNYGCMRDSINHFNYEFKKGDVYLVKGECANGGWALSTIMAGKNDVYSGSIFINGKIISEKQIKKFSCYIGEDAGLKKYFGFKSMSVKEQIEYGINNNLSFCNDINEIKNKFGLSNERFCRSIKYFSGERWKASMAIGYALGKTIYCFPWLNTKDLLHLEEHIKLCLKSLIEVGAIIIIPTTKEETIKRITKNYQVIELD